MGPSQYLVEPKALLKNLQIQWAFVHNWGLFLFSFFFYSPHHVVNSLSSPVF